MSAVRQVVTEFYRLTRIEEKDNYSFRIRSSGLCTFKRNVPVLSRRGCAVMCQSIRCFAALAISVSASWAQAGIPAICEQDNGKFIVDCAKTCKAACEDARFFTPNHAQSCDRIIALAPEQLTDKQECTPPKERCGELVPDESLPTPRTAKPPECFRSFPHLICQADVIKTGIEKILNEFGPVIKKVDISKFVDDTVICQYTKKDLDNIYNESERLKKLHKEMDNNRLALNDCINKTVDWVKELKCPVGTPEDLCKALPKSFSDKSKAAADRMTQSNEKAGVLVKEIDRMQAGIDFIFQVYKYACPKTHQ